MKGKQVLITGGTGGLGLGVVPTVLSKGALITIPYNSERGLERFQSQLPAAEFEQIRFVQADLSQESTVEKLINDLAQVDVLIHLVGGFSMSPVVDTSWTDWQKSFDLNLNTAFLVCKHCLKLMTQHNYGRIVTVGSRGALEPAAQLGAYCAAKAALIAFTKVIAQETKGTNITANSVVLSVIDTPKNRDDMGANQAQDWVSPESIGEVISFLASEAAINIRGAAVPIYGNI